MDSEIKGESLDRPKVAAFLSILLAAVGRFVE